MFVLSSLDVEISNHKYGSKVDMCHYIGCQHWFCNFRVCCVIRTVAEVAGFNVFQNSGRVLFPHWENKGCKNCRWFNIIWQWVSTWLECVPIPGCIHACPLCTLASSLRNLPLPTFAFVQTWRLQSLQSTVEKWLASFRLTFSPA